MLEWELTIVTMDFEMPAMTTLLNVFSRVKIVGLHRKA